MGGGGGTPLGESNQISTGHGVPFIVFRVPSLFGAENNIDPAGKVFSKCMPFSSGRQLVLLHAGTNMQADVAAAAALHFT